LPLQNSRSKASAWARARRIWKTFMKMYVHEKRDASSSRPITIFTTMLALAIIEKTVRSWLTSTVRASVSQCRLHFLSQCVGDFHRLQPAFREAGHVHARLHQHLVLAPHFLREGAAHLAEGLEVHAHGGVVVEARGLHVLDGERRHHEER